MRRTRDTAGRPDVTGEERKRRSIHGLQGEGNREADRRYREQAKRFAESGRAQQAAREAAESVERMEDERRKKAPKKGKKRGA
jgi:hypothetical protein